MLDFFKQENIHKIYLAGIDIDACVLASAFDGFDLGYDVKILQDFCLSHFGEEFNYFALKIMHKNLICQ